MLASKVQYYMTFAVRAISTIFLSFVFVKALMAEEFIAAIIIITFAGLMLFWGAFVLNRFIYAKIDLSNNVLLFGNAFFNNEIEIDKVKWVGRYLYYRKTLKVVIEGRTYYMACLETGLERYFQPTKDK